MAFVDSKSYTKQNLKEREITSKPLELCKTRIKSSSFDMLNFYVVSAGRDMVNDTDMSTRCRSKFKAPSIQTKSTKNEGPSEKNFQEKPLDDIRQNKIHFLA